jgi:hypothetical protein
MEGFSLEERSPRPSIRTWPKWSLLECRHLFAAYVAIGDHLEELAIILTDVTMLGPDEPDGV